MKTNLKRETKGPDINVMVKTKIKVSFFNFLFQDFSHRTLTRIS